MALGITLGIVSAFVLCMAVYIFWISLNINTLSGIHKLANQVEELKKEINDLRKQSQIHQTR